MSRSGGLFFIVGILMGTGSIARAVDCFPSRDSIPLNGTQLSAVNLPHALPSSLVQYQNYLDDTLQSLGKLRGKNGLIQDAAKVIPGDSSHLTQLKIEKSETSPTDIGLDLLTQAALAKNGHAGGYKAFETMTTILATLDDPKFPKYNPDSNHILFYSWYSTKKNEATLKNVSSVDNIHLALALWIVAKNYPDQRVGRMAKELFEKMDLSCFYDPASGLMGGNLTYHKDTQKWTKDAFNYSYFGAETRSIYALGYALGLVKTDRGFDFVSKSVNSMKMELYPTVKGNILRTWDGGAFQTLLPEDLINEDAYSIRLGESANAFGSFMLANGVKVGNTFVPAGFSASQIGEGEYAAQAGNSQLIAKDHTDYCDPAKREVWSKSFTPHAVFLAASVSSEMADRFSSALSGLDQYTSGKDRLYNPGIGFSDGLIVDPKDPHYGKVVPHVLALDQLFIAGGILRTSDPSGRGLSADTLEGDPAVRGRLQEFYKAVDQKLQNTVPNADPVACPIQ